MIHHLQGECSVWRTRKARLYKQCSRVQNLIMKDNNTKFFHAIASMNRRRHNMISNIMIGDRVLEEVNEVENGVISVFPRELQATTTLQN